MLARRCLLILSLLPTLATADAPATLPTTRPGFVPTPTSLEEVREIQERVQQVIEKGLPATVGIQVGGSQGSGVIVSADGLVLTAGHVSGEPGRDCFVIFPNGKRVAATTLGRNTDIDSGMIRITVPGEYPHVPMGRSADLLQGEWVLALGHPGGFRPGRPPVARVGRVIDQADDAVRTDNTLVGGDSGGPLFDLDGNVVAIHSRIGRSTTSNLHVPIDTYTQAWDRLVAGEAMGGRGWDLLAAAQRGPIIGISGSDDERGCLVESIAPDLPAARAGMKPGDVIVRLNDEPISSLASLQRSLAAVQPGNVVTLQVVRDGQTLTLELRPVPRPRGM
jgi:serine protease Do